MARTNDPWLSIWGVWPIPSRPHHKSNTCCEWYCIYIYCHHKPTVQPLTRNVKCTPLLSHPILLLGSQIFEETKLSSNHSHIRIHPILYPHHPHVITIFYGFPGMAYGSVLAVAPSVFRPRAVHNTPQARWKWPGAKLEPEIHGSCWDAAPGIIWDHFPTGGVEYLLKIGWMGFRSYYIPISCHCHKETTSD